MTSPTLTFWGAAGTVTGSRLLVETTASRVLVDAGLYGLPFSISSASRASHSASAIFALASG